MVELQESLEGSTWIDVQFLKTAAEQLIECRRVLKYTYVFGYYLEDGKEKDLFEHLQEQVRARRPLRAAAAAPWLTPPAATPLLPQLEKNTEQLSELTEMPLEAIDRSNVVNYTRVTQRFLNNLLDGVEQGLTESAAGMAMGP